jgi:predicted nucleotidyltransferase
MNPADVAAIANKHGLLLLLRFGSSVTGHLHAAIDVDLAVLFERTPESLGALADHRRYLDMERAYVDRAIGAMTR